MRTENSIDHNDMPFPLDTINWDELAGIGIRRDELEESGELEALLQGEKTEILSLNLILFGIEINMDATLQLIPGSDCPQLEILGIGQNGLRDHSRQAR